jgi:hypothetical protein
MMEPKILSENILIHQFPYFENTAKAVPPSKSFPTGSLVVVTGQPREKVKILYRPLYDTSGNIDMSSPTVESDFPVVPPSGTEIVKLAIATDNQIVRLKDGSLLAEKDGYQWVGTKSESLPRPLLARSTDNGKSWLSLPPVQFPAQWSGGGGCDRTELYACPFTGFVYLTTHAGSPDGKIGTILLFYSVNGGNNWKLIRDNFPSWTPLVMTSTPNGRLFLFHANGEQPTVYYSKTPVTADAIPEIGPGYPVNYMENGKSIPCAGSGPVDTFYQHAHPSISRISLGTTSNKIRVAYQSQNAQGMQEARVICVDVQDATKAPVVTPITTIRAEDPNHSSVMYFTFIDPDYLNMPANAQTNASLLYWIEVSRTLSSRKRYIIRGVVFEGESRYTSPMCLSVRNGAPRSWSKKQDIGDYMAGGFFWKDNTLNYVAQWVEPEGIKANIVTLSYPFSPSPTWKLNSNGHECYLFIDVCRSDNSIEGRITYGLYTSFITGFWSQVWDSNPAGARKLTFIRSADANPANWQIYTGYMLDGEEHIMAGTFETFAGSGGKARRSVFGWTAMPL